MKDDVDVRYGGLPRDLFQDIKRAAYEAKVAEMEDRRRQENRRRNAEDAAAQDRQERADG